MPSGALCENLCNATTLLTCMLHFLQLSMLDILKPAIELAEGGFPVGPVVSVQWKRGLSQIMRDGNPHGRDMLYDGTRAPHPGEIMRMPHLADTFKVWTYTQLSLCLHVFVYVHISLCVVYVSVCMYQCLCVLCMYHRVR